MVPTRWIQTAAAVKCGRGEQKQHVLSVIIHHGRDSKGSACHKLGNNRFKVNKGLSFYLNSCMVQIIKCLFFEKNMGWVTSEASEGCTIIEVPLSKHFDRGSVIVFASKYEILVISCNHSFLCLVYYSFHCLLWKQSIWLPYITRAKHAQGWLHIMNGLWAFGIPAALKIWQLVVLTKPELVFGNINWCLRHFLKNVSTEPAVCLHLTGTRSEWAVR